VERSTRRPGDELGTAVPTPPDNVGPRSTPNYKALAAAAITNLPGGIKVFAGQRDDPSYRDLGSIFDLGGLRPFNPFHIIPLGSVAGVDALRNANTHSIEIQVPISQVVAIPNTTIGIYATASRMKETVIGDDGSKTAKGGWVQVSRLGNPMIDEVLIPIGSRGSWNHGNPSDSQFERFYSAPEFAHLENFLYGSVLQPIQETGRTDLDTMLLTGLPGLNSTG
jgi:hypothetical protein